MPNSRPRIKMLNRLLLRELQLIESASHLAPRLAAMLDIGEELNGVSWTATGAYEALTRKRNCSNVGQWLALLMNCLFFGAIAVLATPAVLALYASCLFLRNPDNDPRNSMPPPPALFVAALSVAFGLAIYALTR